MPGAPGLGWDRHTSGLAAGRAPSPRLSVARAGHRQGWCHSLETQHGTFLPPRSSSPPFRAHLLLLWQPKRPRETRQGQYNRVTHLHRPNFPQTLSGHSVTMDWSGAERKTHLALGQGADSSQRKKWCPKQDLTAARGDLTAVKIKNASQILSSHPFFSLCHIRMYQLC